MLKSFRTIFPVGYAYLFALSYALGITLIVSCVFASGAMAVPSLSTSLQPLGLDPPGIEANDELMVGLLTQTFVDRANSPVAQPDALRLSARLRTRSDARPIGGLLEMGASFDTIVDKQTSFEVPQAYLTWLPGLSIESPEPEDDRVKDHVVVNIGRKREAWSELDSYWTLGVWQPFNRFDGLRPSEQGLSGVFVNFRGEHTEFVGFASALFIPDQGPAYELQDGKFSTNSAWFTQPAQQVVLVSKGTPLRYRLDTPTVGSVITHPSGGFLLRFSEEAERGARVQFAFTSKPRNQLSLPFTGVLVTDSQRPEASVTIFPQVAYHNVFSFEASHASQYWSFGLSTLADFAEPETIPDGALWQSFDSLVLFSPSFEFRAGHSEHYVPWFRVSYLYSLGGDQDLFGGSGMAVPEQNPFTPRLMYRQALSVELRGRLFNLGFLNQWRIEHGLRWIEDFRENGTVLMADLRLASRRNWQIGIYADLLASRQPESLNPGFISRFRGNDRVGAQLSYIF